MKIKDYQEFVRESASPEYEPRLAIVGLVGEVGELADVVKKAAIYADNEKFIEKYGMSVQDKIIDEAGDCLWQLVNVINMYGADLQTVLNNNYKKLINRHNGKGTAKDGGKR